MRRALCEVLPKKIGDSVEISTNEATHLISVLRLKPDDTIELMDGNGSSAIATLFFKGKSLYARLIQAPEDNPELQSLPIHLSMAILKGEAMEWVIEKCVELGVRSLTPFTSEFGVVDIRKKGPEAFQDRWQKIADQALKQCGRLSRMNIHPPTSFEAVLMNSRNLIWLDESLARTSNSPDWNRHHLFSIASDNETELLIGPEGGFSPTEKNRLMQPAKKEIKRAHIGAAILRAETAALFGVSLLKCKWIKPQEK